MGEVFKLPIQHRGEVKEINFHCGTFATEKTLETLGIKLSELLQAFDERFSSTIRHFIYFSAYDAEKQKTPRGEPVNFPYDLDDVYEWMDYWGGGNAKTTETFTRKLLISLYGEDAAGKLAGVSSDGDHVEESEKKSQKRKLTGKKTS